MRAQTIRRRRDIGKQRVVIAGGGVGALEAMLALHHLADQALATTAWPPDKIAGRYLAPFLAAMAPRVPAAAHTAI